jgi:hypothetical protein
MQSIRNLHDIARIFIVLDAITSTRKEQQHSEQNHGIKTMKHIKKNRMVQKTYYITWRRE